LLSDDIQLTDNTADSNKISGFYLWESHNNTIVNNTANLNQFEGVYLINSSFNDISMNKLSSSYFGVSLDSSMNNTIADNDAASNYYFEVFIHSSPDAEKTIFNNTRYIQEDIIYGVSLSVSEALTPSLQVVDNGTNATYSLILENLGNMPDTYNLTVSSDDAPEVLHREPDTITLGPGAIDYETIKLCVGDTRPGIYRSIIEARSWGEPTVKDSIETWTIVRGEVDSESVTSTIEDSALVTSSINDSAINRSAIINSTISGSTITESVITSSVVVGTTLYDVTVVNAIVTDGVISTGTLTINGITYEIDGEVRIADLVTGSDYSDSNLVGIQDSKTLIVTAEKSDVDFDISAKEDYFVGSMRVQKSEIPPDGIPEDVNGENVGGYVYADVSENVAKSTEWVLVRVYYDQTELGDIDESSLRLRYFNESADPLQWEEIPLGGIDLTEHYVWANISHYSVFSVSGSVTPKRPSKSGGGGGTHADSDDDGLSDLQELILGTDKDNADTDGDGFKDGEDPFPLDPHLPLRYTSTPTPLPTATTIVPTPRPSPPSTPTILEEDEPGFEFPTPGFEALVTIGGLLAVAYLVLRRRRG
jgi:PGF-CTERM protein